VKRTLLERAIDGVSVVVAWDGGTSLTLIIEDALGSASVSIPASEVLDAFHHPYLRFPTRNPWGRPTLAAAGVLA
jgi:hypothetical protein